MADLEKIAEAVEMAERRSGVAPLAVADGLLDMGVPLEGTGLKLRLAVGHLIVLAKVGHPIISRLLGGAVADAGAEIQLKNDMIALWVASRSAKECREAMEAGVFFDSVERFADEFPCAAWILSGVTMDQVIFEAFSTMVSMEAQCKGGTPGKRWGRAGLSRFWTLLSRIGGFLLRRRWR